jgi:hypothetical protein
VSETLREKQSRFVRMVARLIDKATEMGFDLTLGDGFRDPRSHGELGIFKAYGNTTSCHKLRLAIDLNLFKDGKYLGTTEAHQLLGEWWESQGGTWGGRFEDGNHYSLEHEGRK